MASDAPGIVAIWNAVIAEGAVTFLPDPKTPREIETMIAERPGVLVATGPEGGVAGFVTWAQFRAGRGYAHAMEHTLHLAPSARRRGLGRALLSAAETQAAGAGTRVMVAGVSSANPQGRRFHLACGYVEQGVLSAVGTKYGCSYDLHLLTKRLRADAV